MKNKKTAYAAAAAIVVLGFLINTLLSSQKETLQRRQPQTQNKKIKTIIIENKEIASYYASAFYTDWQLNPDQQNVAYESSTSSDIVEENSNSIYIIILFIMTFAVIARDWRKRPWT